MSFGEGPRPYGDEPERRSSERWIFVVLCLLVILGAACYFWSRSAPPSTAGVTAIQSRLTLEKDDGGNLIAIDRQTKPEVWYRVTLDHAPLGAKLALHCDWTAPGGQIVHQNQYETRVIDKEVWPTHARFQIGPDAPAGKWTATLSTEGRVLCSSSFDIQDGNALQAPIKPAEKADAGKP